MLRSACLILGLAIVATPLLSERIISHDDPGFAGIDARGGNPADGKGSARCDFEAGTYVGCTQVGGTCTQCIVVGQPNVPPSMADTLDPNAPKGATGYMNGQNGQNCGDIATGKCVADPGGPTGFKCILNDTGQVCSNGVLTVVAQPAGPPVVGPPNPTGPSN